jgi:hypothetical protein
MIREDKKFFSVLQNIQIGNEAYPAFSAVDIGGTFHGGKVAVA